MGKALRASVLLLLLTCPARAGWIQNGSPEPPPPPQTYEAQQPATAAAVEDGTQGTLQSGLTRLALDLLAALL